MEQLIASIELQKALFLLLDGAYPIYEVVPVKPAFPYITVKPMSKVDDNTKTDTRTDHSIYIHTWSRGNSSLEQKQMQHFVYSKLTTDFYVNGFDVAYVEQTLEANQEEVRSEDTIFHGTGQWQITLSKK